MSANRHVRNAQSGFTAVEMMISLLILGIITGGIFAQIDLAQQRAFSEQVKLDNFQEARDFVDQFFRDVNQIGYPNSRMVDSNPLTTSWSPLLASPLINDNRLAIGLVKIEANAIQFEGDMKGDGVVQSIIYKINGSAACPLCLQRSQVDKVLGDPLTGQAAPNTETNVSANFRDEQTAYFASKGGIEEARDRMRSTATNSLSPKTTLANALPGQPNGILYVTNPAAGEIVAPWLTTGANYPDDEI